MSLALHKKIRSFVRREGRMTPGQMRSFKHYWPRFGLEVSDQNKVVAPVILEIGFGMGDSLIDLAKRYPDVNFVGVEVYRPGIGSLFTKLVKEEIENVRVFCADATDVIESSVPDKSLSAVLILFPDPWPKKRHHKRRLIQIPFINSLKSKLQEGGELYLVTDWEDYANHMSEVMSQVEGFKKISSDKSQLVLPETKYRRRGEKLGHTVAELVYQWG